MMSNLVIYLSQVHTKKRPGNQGHLNNSMYLLHKLYQMLFTTGKHSYRNKQRQKRFLIFSGGVANSVVK